MADYKPEGIIEGRQPHDPVLFKSKEHAEKHIAHLKKTKKGRKGEYGTYSLQDGSHGITYNNPRYMRGGMSKSSQHSEAVCMNDNIPDDPSENFNYATPLIQSSGYYCAPVSGENSSEQYEEHVPVTFHGNGSHIEHFDKLVHAHGGNQKGRSNQFTLPTSKTDQFHLAAKRKSYIHGHHYTVGEKA